MRYISTRDAAATPAHFTDILLGGLAPDGGLYLPEEYPSLDEAALTRLRETLTEQGYAALAAEVLKLFIDDIPEADIEAIAARAYRYPVFDDEQIVPVSHVEGNLYIGHLSQGPTAAFKDMAMQLLGELFEYELVRRDQPLNILGATSGDTGSAAEYAMRGRDRISVFMLTPAGRMTPFQQAQMFGLDDENIVNMALNGVFDDCQDVVKAISGDSEFKEKYHVGAVNSINWARLMAQVVYYISCWIRVTTDNSQKVSFSVPTGNFGDICAGHIARQMGLPIDRLIVATNENNVLDEFFRTGEYRVRSAAETWETSSPSMDISRASNFERFIFDAVGRDADRTKELFGMQVKGGGFSLAGDAVFPRLSSEFGFASGSSRHEDRVREIGDLYARLGVLVDPHTADGLVVARRLSETIEGPIVCLETALPVKFSDTIREATGKEPPIPERFAAIMEAPRRVRTVSNSVDEVKNIIVSHVEGGA
ncbi:MULTISPECIES: threonine synthase [unclassified Corynebacterium]|uniref:threonine synthase n=1 Tax=unclassified Corynebacterium TaxID=2624378 RepID=UPI0029C9C23E|nr:MULTISPECIES: threonine synthase [unclassified Corynebacterium]WPF65500.1 threonine synthase [Corynebacterium sp. 22KM0430]WPF67996.1 threonine synthase [Corynebacterium sp. 21KM1197]